VTFESRKDDEPPDNSSVDYGIAIPRAAVESLYLNHLLIAATRAIWSAPDIICIGHSRGWNSYCHAHPT